MGLVCSSRQACTSLLSCELWASAEAMPACCMMDGLSPWLDALRSEQRTACPVSMTLKAGGCFATYDPRMKLQPSPYVYTCQTQ